MTRPPPGNADARRGPNTCDIAHQHAAIGRDRQPWNRVGERRAEPDGLHRRPVPIKRPVGGTHGTVAAGKRIDPSDRDLSAAVDGDRQPPRREVAPTRERTRLEAPVGTPDGDANRDDRMAHPAAGAAIIDPAHHDASAAPDCESREAHRHLVAARAWDRARQSPPRGRGRGERQRRSGADQGDEYARSHQPDRKHRSRVRPQYFAAAPCGDRRMPAGCSAREAQIQTIRGV